MLSLFTSNNLLGVDIGSYSIKVVQLKGSGKSYTLAAAACVKITDVDIASPEALTALLAGVLSSNGITAKKAATVLTGPSLQFRHLYLPEMPSRDFMEAVRWELRKDVGISAEELAADYVVAGDESAGKDNKVSVIAFAARRAEVERTMEVFRAASLDLRVVDVVPVALFNAYCVNDEWEESLNYALLEIGERKSVLSIVKNKKLVFTREITFGGGDITRSLTSATGISAREADEYKTACGLGPGDGSNEEARAAIASAVEGLAAELQRSLDYYQAQFRGGAVQKVFLSGGTARLPGIDDFIADTTGLLCFVDDPFRNIKMAGSIDKEELGRIAPCMKVALGLATRTI